MVDTKRFRTRQEMKMEAHPKGRGYIIGLDVGYSATKVFYENGYFVFPSYVKEVGGVMDIASDKDIFYRGEDGRIYLVGYNAQEMMQSDDTNDTDGELFSRKRYKDKRFQIICHTAIALATQSKKDGRKVVIQTGLPSSYVKGDTAALKKVLSTSQRFELKIGRGDWAVCNVEVNPQDIYVMDQPAGGLWSVLIKNDGNYLPNARDILTGNVLVLDIGFGTFDFYGFIGRNISCRESIDSIGMREVLSESISQVMTEMGEDIRIAAFQKNLESGVVTCFDEETLCSEDKPLAPILDAANKKVMQDAMNRARSVTKSFRDYRYLIIDGGTGEAWFQDICEWLKGMKTIQIIPSNFNDHKSFIYSNARGYYMFRLNQPKAKP